MAFVRRRGNNTTLIETYREGDKVEQRLIANLYGQNSVAEDLQELERQIAEPEQWLRGNPYDDPNDISDRRQPLFSYIDENGNEAIHFSYSQPRRKTREHERRERRIARLQEDRERLLTFTSPLPTLADFAHLEHWRDSKRYRTLKPLPGEGTDGPSLDRRALAHVEQFWKPYGLKSRVRDCP